MNWQVIGSVGLFLIVSLAFKSGMFTSDAATDQSWPNSVEFAVEQDAIVSRITPQATAPDDQWRIYCAGRKSVSREIQNDTITEPAVFFAWKVHDSEVLQKLKVECHTNNLTANFITERLIGNKLKIATSTRLKTTIRIGQFPVKTAISFDMQDVDFKKELRLIEQYKKHCDVDTVLNELGIYYAYQKGQYCPFGSKKLSQEKKLVSGYSLDSTSGDLAIFVCFNNKTGLCSLRFGRENLVFSFTFPHELLPAWRGIKEEVEKMISERVVLNYQTGSCSGDLCDELLQVLN